MAEETPPPSSYESSVLGWLHEAIQEGEGFLESQYGYEKIAATIDDIMGQKVELRPSDFSGVTYNHLGKVASDLAAGMTDVRPFWEYVTYNKQFESAAQLKGKIAAHWWTNRLIDMRMNDAIKYCLAAGSSFTHLTFNEVIQDLDMTAEDPRDVIPVRPAGNWTVQDALAVIIRRSRPVHYLQARYPAKASSIVADRDASFASGRVASQVGRILRQIGPSLFQQRLFGDAPKAELPKVPVADLFTAYIDDRSRNTSSVPVPMGRFDRDGNPLTTWSYMVPPGAPLYPRKRLVVATRKAILYDGPSVYWHGLFPMPKLTLDPWPWTWLGKAPLWDLRPLQYSLDRILRIVDDHFEKFARPDVIADKNSISNSNLRKINTRRSGLHIRHNPLAGKGIEIRYPDPLPAEVWRAVELYLDGMDKLSGTRDLSQMLRLNQLPSTSTIEKVLESLSPSVRLRSRVLEAFLREFAIIVAFNIAQFYTLPRRMRILGEQGVTFEDFDFDPDTVIPDYVHREDFSPEGGVTAEALARGPRPRLERATEYVGQLEFHVAPGSLLSASEIERKLLYLQLSRAGLIDHWTLLEMLSIPNVGKPPVGADTITDRLKAEQEMGLGMNISPVGRKATGQTMPRMVMKES